MAARSQEGQRAPCVCCTEPSSQQCPRVRGSCSSTLQPQTSVRSTGTQSPLSRSLETRRKGSLFPKVSLLSSPVAEKARVTCRGRAVAQGGSASLAKRCNNSQPWASGAIRLA